jgi:hypothetical protein
MGKEKEYNIMLSTKQCEVAKLFTGYEVFSDNQQSSGIENSFVTLPSQGGGDVATNKRKE